MFLVICCGVLIKIKRIYSVRYLNWMAATIVLCVYLCRQFIDIFYELPCVVFCTCAFEMFSARLFTGKEQEGLILLRAERSF